jgi:hypothetical protein
LKVKHFPNIREAIGIIVGQNDSNAEKRAKCEEF